MLIMSDMKNNTWTVVVKAVMFDVVWKKTLIVFSAILSDLRIILVIDKFSSQLSS